MSFLRPSTLEGFRVAVDGLRGSLELHQQQVPAGPKMIANAALGRGEYRCATGIGPHVDLRVMPVVVVQNQNQSDGALRRGEGQASGVFRRGFHAGIRQLLLELFQIHLAILQGRSSKRYGPLVLAFAGGNS